MKAGMEGKVVELRNTETEDAKEEIRQSGPIRILVFQSFNQED